MEIIKVAEKILETPTITTLRFNETIDAKPGQFLMVWIPEFSEKQEVICSWDSDDELVYALSADEQPGGYSHEECWASLEPVLQSESSDFKLNCLQHGEYFTNSNERITFRVYKFNSESESQVHIYHLISTPKVAYWFIGSIVNYSDIFQVNNEIKEIIKTVNITKKLTIKY